MLAYLPVNSTCPMGEFFFSIPHFQTRMFAVEFSYKCCELSYKNFNGN